MVREQRIKTSGNGNSTRIDPTKPTVPSRSCSKAQPHSKHIEFSNAIDDQEKVTPNSFGRSTAAPPAQERVHNPKVNQSDQWKAKQVQQVVLYFQNRLHLHTRNVRWFAHPNFHAHLPPPLHECLLRSTSDVPLPP